ncbi:Glycosyl transferase, family 4, partial [Dillenia turbinata]
MAARKRAVASDYSTTKRQTSSEENTTSKNATSKTFTLSPPKSSQMLAIFSLFAVPYSYLLFFHCTIDHGLQRCILINALLSFAGFLLTLFMITVDSRYLLRRNLSGYDINKKGTPQGSIKVPESLGIVVGIVFLVLAMLFQYLNFTADSIWLVEYNVALACISFMILLGDVDDALDIPWRVWKNFASSCAALPLLMAYAGHTTIIIPKPLIPYVGLEVLDLGWIYKLYMGLLVVFCTNSINIHAGINGLEVGQTVVVACAILIHNVMQIGASGDLEYKQAHAFSVYLGSCTQSLTIGAKKNYSSEILLIFFTPQVLNFLLSLPQLSGYRHCPRHRLPRFDPTTGLLTGTNDGTLVNLSLRLCGSMLEKSLCILLLVFQ